MIHPVPMRHRPFLLALNLVWACVGASAQANSELTGIVTDQTGAVVAGAKIVLIDPATELSKTTESGSTGLYDISGLNPANYNLKVTANGFGAFVQNGIAINVSSTSRVNVKLTVGAESQTVTVEAGALTVQTDSNVVQHRDQLQPDQRNCDGKPQFRSPCRAWPRRQFGAPRQQPALVRFLWPQHERTESEPQYLAHRWRRIR